MSSLTSPPTSHARPADQGTSTATLLDLRRSRWTPRKRRCGPGGVLSAEHQTSSKELTVYDKCHPDHTNARATPQTRRPSSASGGPDGLPASEDVVPQVFFLPNTRPPRKS